MISRLFGIQHNSYQLSSFYQNKPSIIHNSIQPISEYLKLDQSEKLGITKARVYEILGIRFKEKILKKLFDYFSIGCVENGTCYRLNASDWLGPINMVEPIYGIIMPILILITILSNTLIIIVLSRFIILEIIIKQ